MILILLVWREIGVRVKMCELVSVSESKNIQWLHRSSILCNSRLVFLIWCQEPFCLKSISNNAGEAVFVEYVFSICVENVPKIFTIKIAGMSELNYWERLKK